MTTNVYFLKVRNTFTNKDELYHLSNVYLVNRLMFSNASSEDLFVPLTTEENEQGVEGFIKKLIPEYSRESKIIDEEKAMSEIQSLIDDEYIEDLESLIVNQRAQWLSIIYLLYSKKIDLSFLNQFFRVNENRTRSTMLIEKLVPKDADYLDIFDTFQSFITNFIGDIGKKKDYFEFDGRSNRAPKFNKFFSNKSHEKKIEVSFPVYYFYEGVCTEYNWDVFNWTSINSSRNKNVTKWDMDGVMPWYEKLLRWIISGVSMGYISVAVISAFIPGPGTIVSVISALASQLMINGLGQPPKSLINERHRYINLGFFDEYIISRFYHEFVYNKFKKELFLQNSIGEPVRSRIYSADPELTADAFLWSVGYSYNRDNLELEFGDEKKFSTSKPGNDFSSYEENTSGTREAYLTTYTNNCKNLEIYFKEKFTNKIEESLTVKDSTTNDFINSVIEKSFPSHYTAEYTTIQNTFKQLYQTNKNQDFINRQLESIFNLRNRILINNITRSSLVSSSSFSSSRKFKANLGSEINVPEAGNLDPETDTNNKSVMSGNSLTSKNLFISYEFLEEINEEIDKILRKNPGLRIEKEKLQSDTTNEVIKTKEKIVNFFSGTIFGIFNDKFNNATTLGEKLKYSVIKDILKNYAVYLSSDSITPSDIKKGACSLILSDETVRYYNFSRFYYLFFSSSSSFKTKINGFHEKLNGRLEFTKEYFGISSTNMIKGDNS